MTPSLPASRPPAASSRGRRTRCSRAGSRPPSSATQGFLPSNFRPGRRATIFPGDAGSTFLGFTLAALAVLGEWAENRVVDLAAPVLIFGVFTCDMLYVARSGGDQAAYVYALDPVTGIVR